MTKALVVLSGGLDSCVALGIACKENPHVEAVSFFYGQKHERELEAAASICQWYGVRSTVRGLTLGLGGALMDTGVPMPQMTYEELAESQGPSATYVPFRNGTMLANAASLALERECDVIYAGMHGEDAHNWAYPDCTPEFIGAMQNAIYVGTYHKVRLVAPFTYMKKSEIIMQGVAINAPLHLTLSCYEGTVPACGKCPTCIARREAFKAVGVDDPIQYETEMA